MNKSLIFQINFLLRILVTHSATFLAEVDQVVVVNGGKIIEAGTYQDLLDKKVNFADFINQYLKQDVE
jgi:ABC-type bacteriocin/lantibiotic exporter with double-glycine peptidase domain